jgi:preprotein translocase subunit SecB
MSLIDYELATIRLLKSVFMPNPQFEGSREPEASGSTEITLSIKNSGDFSDNDTVAHFVQNFRIESASSMPFLLEVEFGAIFKTERPVPKNEQSRYISQVFSQSVFPYLSEYVSSITVRAGYPPILLHLAFTPHAGGPKDKGSKTPGSKEPGGTPPTPKPVLKWIH